MTKIVLGALNPVPLEFHVKYSQLLSKHVEKSYKTGRKIGELLISSRLATKADYIKFDLPGQLFQSDPLTTSRIQDHTFTAAQSTLDRVDQSVMNTISEGFKEGEGINDINKRVNQQFTSLKGWESERIARTEVNSAQNKGAFDIYTEENIDCIQWWSAGHDGRTRDSHLEMHGLIIRRGFAFPNGLLYPGDTNGALKEFINCRCTALPYILLPNQVIPGEGTIAFRETEITTNNFFDEEFTYAEVIKPHIIQPSSKPTPVDIFKEPKNFDKLTATQQTEYKRLKTILDEKGELGELNRLKYNMYLKKMGNKNLIPRNKARRATNYKPKTKPKNGLTYEKVKTPADMEKYFGMKYTDKNFEHTFYDEKYDTEIIIKKGLDDIIDISNSGKSNYDLKELLSYYDKADPLLKESTRGILVTNRIGEGSYADTNEEYYIRLFYDTLKKSREEIMGEGVTVQQTLYHEMGHCVDWRFTPKTRYDIWDKERGWFSSGEYKQIWRKEKWSSWYEHFHFTERVQGSFTEGFAESVGMIEMERVGDGSKAIMRTQKKYSSFSNSKVENTSYKKWAKKYPDRVKYINKLLDNK